MKARIESNLIKANEIHYFSEFLNKVTAKLNAGLVTASEYVVNRDLDGTFKKKGESVELTVRIPSTAATHSDSGNSATDFKEGKRIIKMDNILTVDHELTLSELANQISQGKTEIIDSMYDGLVDKIETDMLATMAARSLGYSGTPGTTISATSSLLAARKFLTKYRVPRNDRYGILEEEAAANILDLDQWKNVSTAGESAGLIESSIGRRFGVSWHESPFPPTVTLTGTFEAKNKTTTGSVTAASNTTTTDGLPISLCTIKAASDTSKATLSAGAQGTIVSTTQGTIYFTVVEAKESATVSADEVVTEAKIYTNPAINANISDGAVTFIAKNKSAGVKNMIWQKDCVYMVARPIEPYPDKPSVTLISPTGLPLRLSMGSNILTKKTQISLDLLWKPYVARPEGVTTIYG